jgi:hypothetical protein
MVQDFLRGQNLEQIGRVDDAVRIYEQIVAEHFDAAGPYDRLIWIYQSRSQHQDVVRVAEASLSAVHTYPEKAEWYRQQIQRAKDAMGTTPEARER